MQKQSEHEWAALVSRNNALSSMMCQFLVPLTVFVDARYLFRDFTLRSNFKKIPENIKWVEILQARVLVWIAISFFRESPWPRDQTQISFIAGGFFTIWATKEAQQFVENF